MGARQRSIMLVVNCLDIGGAEIQVVRLAIGLQRRGWRVCVVSLLPPGPLAQPLNEANVPVHGLNMRPGVPNPLGLMRLKRIVREEKPDVVHSHIVHSNVLARCTRLITPMRVLVCTAHNVKEGGRTAELSYRYTDSLADLTTNVSQAAVDRYIQVKAAPPGRIRFVPNGLDVNRFRKDETLRQRTRQELGLHDEFVWLAIGRLFPQKDYPNMFRAFAAAISEKDGATRNALLLLAGTGPLESELRAGAERLGVGDRVRFLGHRSDVPELMNASDAFVLSSAWEGMPLVLQEASACELPIVATRVGGNAEVVLDGLSGLLVPSGDSNALSAAMKRMTTLPPTDRAAMGRTGRDFIAGRYNMERVLGEWEGIYEELLTAHPER